jgi:hypothetical protein
VASCARFAQLAAPAALASRCIRDENVTNAPRCVSDPVLSLSTREGRFSHQGLYGPQPQPAPEAAGALAEGPRYLGIPPTTPTLIPRRDYLADVCSSPLARTRRDWLLRRVQD